MSATSRRTARTRSIRGSGSRAPRSIEEPDGDPRLLMKAFRKVAAAQGGVSAIARIAEVDRVALSRGLSGNRDPRLGTVTKIAAACGVSLRFVQREATK